jgi:asparagine synthase (glutamine-hydrolysing)
VKDLRGNFSGFIYDSENNKLTIFTDHLASKPIYYFYDEKSNTLIFSSELKVVVQGMKELGFEPCLDVSASYCLLTFGYMLGDLTLIKEVKKLSPGNVLIYENGKIEFKQYYKLSSTPYIEDSEEGIIKELDRRFKKAVQLEYEKDLEYGYSHITTMSGGLDCRTNVAYANKLNFKDITCFTFSQSNYLDEKIAKKICSDNHLEFIFYSLDNGTYLTKNIDNIINSNDGLILYSGSAHLYNCLKRLSLNDYGLVHTGQIGDLVLGSYLKSKEHEKIDNKILHKVSYSDKLLHELTNKIDFTNFNCENDELFAFYERCVNGVFNGYRMIEQFTEFSSPFLYLEFLEYAMRIHPKYRYQEAIYLKWISRYTPEFAKYRWEKYGMSPMQPLFLLNLFNKLRHILHLINKQNKKQLSMNPTEYWWEMNKSLQEYINSVFETEIQNVADYPDLIVNCRRLFMEGSLLEKTQVITLLKAVNLLGLKDKKDLISSDHNINLNVTIQPAQNQLIDIDFTNHPRKVGYT